MTGRFGLNNGLYRPLFCPAYSEQSRFPFSLDIQDNRYISLRLKQLLIDEQAFSGSGDCDIQKLIAFADVAIDQGVGHIGEDVLKC
jgi:hypothetical protein